MDDLIKLYSCPVCNNLASPLAYDKKNPNYVGSYRAINYCYKMEGDTIAFPVQMMSPIQCCEGYYVAPYHPTSKDYIEAIRPYFGFFAPIVPWIRNLIDDELNAVKL